MEQQTRIRLTDERTRRGLSQTKLAQKVGCNPTSISRIERGKEPPYPIRARKIAAALGWDGDPMALFEPVE